MVALYCFKNLCFFFFFGCVIHFDFTFLQNVFVCVCVFAARVNDRERKKATIGSSINLCTRFDIDTNAYRIRMANLNSVCMVIAFVFICPFDYKWDSRRMLLYDVDVYRAAICMYVCVLLLLFLSTFFSPIRSLAKFVVST